MSARLFFYYASSSAKADEAQTNNFLRYQTFCSRLFLDPSHGLTKILDFLNYFAFSALQLSSLLPRWASENDKANDFAD